MFRKELYVVCDECGDKAMWSHSETARPLYALGPTEDLSDGWERKDARDLCPACTEMSTTDG